MTPCRFCSDRALVKVALSAGCLCYPDDREQALCLHHAMRATPLGTIDLIAIDSVGPSWMRDLLERRYAEARSPNLPGF